MCIVEHERKPSFNSSDFLVEEGCITDPLLLVFYALALPQVLGPLSLDQDLVPAATPVLERVLLGPDEPPTLPRHPGAAPFHGEPGPHRLDHGPVRLDRLHHHLHGARAGRRVSAPGRRTP